MRPWISAPAAEVSQPIHSLAGDWPNLPAKPRSGLLVMTLEGEVIARWSRYGYGPGNRVWPHDLAVGDNSEVFVGAVFDAKGVQKFRRGCGAPARTD